MEEPMKGRCRNFQAAVIILLALSVIASVIAAAVVSKKEKPDLTIMVITDIHVFSEAQVGDYQSEAYQSFDAARNGKMVHLSECIFKSAVDKILQNKPDVLFVAGDMSDIHSIETHYLVADQFRKLESAGIRVYVVPGNHDTANDNSVAFTSGTETEIPGTKSADMKAIYGEFGYNDAKVKDSRTMSYVADLNSRYSLISIDAYDSNRSDDSTRRLIHWTAEQSDALVAQGRVPLGLIHFPILGHYGNFVDNLSMLQSRTVHLADEYRDAMIASGMHYVFTGHLHSNDISVYENEYGTLYDIETAALANTPSTIRTIACYGDKLVISTENLDKINPDYIPSYIPAEERAKILSDYQAFAREYFCIDMAGFFFEGMFPDSILNVLNMFGLEKTDAGTFSLRDRIMVLLHDYAYLPIYISDEKDGSSSLQRICAQYGITLPASGYKNIFDLLLNGVAGANFRGDENITKDSKEGILARYSIYAAFYFLADSEIFRALHALNPDIEEIDLMPAMPDLFTKGELDLVRNNLIAGIAESSDLIRNHELLSGLIGLTSQEWLDAITVFAELEIFGLKPLKYLSAENGTLLLGSLLDNILFSKVGKGILTDDNPPDNNIVLDTIGGTWYVQD